MFIKSLVAKLFGQRSPIFNSDLSHIDSVLLNPVGDAVGDAVAHCLHLRQLKMAYPHIRIGVLVTERNRDVYKLSNIVDELVPMKALSYFKERKKWDLYLDFTTRFNTKTIILDKILAPQRVMIFTKTPKKYYSLDNIKNYDFFNPVPAGTHFKDYLNHSAISAYLPQDSLHYQLGLTTQDKKRADQHWQPNKIRILLSPQGSSKPRYLPAVESAEILKGISAHLRDKVQIILGYSPYAEEYLKVLSQHIEFSPLISIAPKTTVREYLALVNSADIVLAVDSGTVHVACAFEKPLLAFYANYPQNISHWKPHNKNSENTKMLLGNAIAENSDATQEFNCAEAIDWLNTQLAKYL